MWCFLWLGFVLDDLLGVAGRGKSFRHDQKRRMRGEGTEE